MANKCTLSLYNTNTYHDNVLLILCDYMYHTIYLWHCHPNTFLLFLFRFGYK